jgi:putative transposase
MRKLNCRKIRWIIGEMRKKDLSVYRIAKKQDITPRWCRELYARFSSKPVREMKLRKPGRKVVPLDVSVASEIVSMKRIDPTLGAVAVRKLLEEKGIFVSFNGIRKFLRETGLSKVEIKKSRRRKWVRYERDNSNSLWHTDYCEIDGKQLIAYIDDASRFIVGYGIFDNATTSNALSVFLKAVKKYGIPKQLMTDHGTQFCIDKENDYKFRDIVEKQGTELILARVKHPQSNGKIERFFRTVRLLLPHFGNIDKVMEYYNYRRPHMSLETDEGLVRPYEAFVLKGGKMDKRLLNGEVKQIY